MSADTLAGSPGPRAAAALFAILSDLHAERGPYPEWITALEESIADVAALHVYTERQEANMAALTQSALDAHREVNRLNALIPAAMRDAEASLATAGNQVDEACAAFNVERARTDALRKESLRDFTIPLTREPRTAAGA